MADQLQLRGGVTTDTNNFTGAPRELTIDTTKNTAVVHDGFTTGGHPLAKESEVVKNTGDQTITGDQTFEGDLNVTGDQTVGGNQAVTGSLSITGDLNSLTVERSVGTLNDLLDVNHLTVGSVRVLNYHSGLEGGGGVFYWDATKAKSEHNGGTVIDPTVVFPTDWDNQTQLATWFDTANAGAGVWVRQYDGAVNVKWFGAKGDGVSVENTVVQKVLNSFKNIVFSEGYYLVDAVVRLHLDSDTLINFEEKAVLKAAPTSADNHSIFQCVNKSNITLVNPQLIGERYEHIGTEGESGVGFRCISSKNIKVLGGYSKEFWGDGLYFGAFDASLHTNCENIIVKNFISEDNRRQGMSLTGVINASFDSCVFKGTGGTAPEAGVDIEPNNIFLAQNISFSNCNFLDNAGCGAESVKIGASNSEAVKNINFVNCNFKNNQKDGLKLATSLETKTSNCLFENNSLSGIYAIAESLLLLDNSIVKGNISNGISITTGSKLVANNCNVFDNVGSGISVRDFASIQNCSVYNNNNKGIIVESNATEGAVSVSNCNIKNNGGTGVYSIGSLSLESCYVEGNATTSGRNIEIYGDNCKVINNNVRVGNNLNKPEFGIRSTSNSGLVLKNNDFRNSGVSDIYTATLTNREITNNFPYTRSGSFSDRPTQSLEQGMLYFSTNSPNNRLLCYTFGGNWLDLVDGTVYS